MIQAKGPGTSVDVSIKTMGMTPLSATTSSSKLETSSSRGNYIDLSRVVKTCQGTLFPTDELKKGSKPRSER